MEPSSLNQLARINSFKNPRLRQNQTHDSLFNSDHSLNKENPIVAVKRFSITITDLYLIKEAEKISYDEIHDFKEIGDGGFNTVFKVTYNSSVAAYKELKTEPDDDELRYQQLFTCGELERRLTIGSESNYSTNSSYHPSHDTGLLTEEDIIQDSMLTLYEEGSLINSLRSENIVKIYGFIEKTTSLRTYISGLLMEYTCMTDANYAFLQCPLKHNLTAVDRVTAIKEVAAAIEYLHNRTIKTVIHRDIKLEQILVFKNTDGPNKFTCKLSDFGLAKILDSCVEEFKSDRIVGTEIYMAPEVYLEKIYGTPVDIYSFSFMMYEILTGVLVFSGNGSVAQLNMLRNDCKPLIYEDWGENIEQILTNTWCRHRANRWTADKVL